jgi:hypothetical protein
MIHKKGGHCRSALLAFVAASPSSPSQAKSKIKPFQKHNDHVTFENIIKISLTNITIYRQSLQE